VMTAMASIVIVMDFRVIKFSSFFGLKIYSFGSFFDFPLIVRNDHLCLRIFIQN